MKSENWGGAISLLGSCFVALAGDTESIFSMIAFLSAELTALFVGQSTLGYSIGCLLFAGGDALLCFSRATADNLWLKYTMASIAMTWSVGATRYPAELIATPLETYAPRAGSLVRRYAQAIQPIVGAFMIVQRLPALFISAFNGTAWMPNPAMFIATSMWAISDVLYGRVQHYVGKLFA